MPRTPTDEERLDSWREDVTKKVLQHRRESRVFSRVAQGWSYAVAAAEGKLRGVVEAFLDSLHPDHERTLIRWPDSILWLNRGVHATENLLGDDAPVVGRDATIGRDPALVELLRTVSFPSEEGSTPADESRGDGQGSGEGIPSVSD